MTGMVKINGLWIAIDEIDQQERETTKSMKPKVQWRCLRTEPPKMDGRYWFCGMSGAVELLWLDSKTDGDAYARGTLSELLKLQWRYWAPYEAPEPPPKPTPFETWWNGLPDPRYIGGDYRHVETSVGTQAVQQELSKACFLAGYEACAKNMAAGGAK